MKGFAHEKARDFRNVIFDFRYFFHDCGDHNADRYNAVFIESSPLHQRIQGVYKNDEGHVQRAEYVPRRVWTLK